MPTREAQQSVKFALARIGTENAVVISRLVGGSAASEVRPPLRPSRDRSSHPAAPQKCCAVYPLYDQVNSSCDHGRYPGMTLPALLASFAACLRQSTQHSFEGRREPLGTVTQLLKARAISWRDGWRPRRAGGGEGRAATAGHLGPDARRGQHAVAPQRPPLHALREGRPVDAPRCAPPLSTALTLVCCSGIKIELCPD